MKKYIIIALAALVAFSACTKTNPEEKKSEKISFTVANYMPQTKANSSLESEGYNSFTCNAWFFPETGANMQYMEDVAVSKKTSGNTTEWAPANDYYWPKTGYINFYSYAGSKNPSVTPSTNLKTVTVKYENVTIAEDDNFMVADPALHFGLANANANLVNIDHEQGDFDYTTGKYTYTNSTQAYTGVPTLFHHMLAKVAFVVKIKTQSAASANTIWTVKILNDDTNNYKSNIEALSMGSLTLTNTDEATAATVGSWNLPSETDKIGWVPSASSVEGAKSEVMPFEDVTLTLPKNQTESTTATLLPIRTVMPQATTSVGFNLAYEVSATHDGENAPFLTEVIKVAKQQLSVVASTVTAWNMNQITLYTITIDPVGAKITFDPAVVEWDSQAATISLPIATTRGD